MSVARDNGELELALHRWMRCPRTARGGEQLSDGGVRTNTTSAGASLLVQSRMAQVRRPADSINEHTSLNSCWIEQAQDDVSAAAPGGSIQDRQYADESLPDHQVQSGVEGRSVPVGDAVLR